MKWLVCFSLILFCTNSIKAEFIDNLTIDMSPASSSIENFYTILNALIERRPFVPAEKCSYSGDGITIEDENIGHLQREFINNTYGTDLVEYVCSHDDPDSRTLQRLFDFAGLVGNISHEDDSEDNELFFDAEMLYVIYYGRLPRLVEVFDEEYKAMLMNQLESVVNRVTALVQKNVR